MSRRTTWEGVESSSAHRRSNTAFLRGSIRIVRRAVRSSMTMEILTWDLVRIILSYYAHLIVILKHMAKSAEPQWVEFESPWSCQPGKVRVLRSAEGVSRDELAKRAWRDELARPYIFETLFERRMH